MTAVAAAVFVGAAPAHAVDSNVKLQSRSDGRCAAVSTINNTLIRPVCTYSQTRWRYQPRSTSPSGRPLVKFQSIYNGGCMDTNGGSWTARVKSIACNAGPNQLWEQFSVSSGGRTYYVYKSWGAWTQLGQHLCLHAHSAHEERLDICDTTSYDQQWTRPAA
ncbi:MAG TPA: hypothetical protein VES42_23360 [Pilimelia sp.]|nr:hypothetical protein [Pilimelia sp.]